MNAITAVGAEGSLTTMPDPTHDPRPPAGRAALRAVLAECSMGAAERDVFAALLDLADERDALAALLREARDWMLPYPRTPADVLKRIDAALAKVPRQ